MIIVRIKRITITEIMIMTILKAIRANNSNQNDTINNNDDSNRDNIIFSEQ